MCLHVYKSNGGFKLFYGELQNPPPCKQQSITNVYEYIRLIIVFMCPGKHGRFSELTY